MLKAITDDLLRDFISIGVDEEPEKRATIDELLAHPFLLRGENDHHTVNV